MVSDTNRATEPRGRWLTELAETDQLYIHRRLLRGYLSKDYLEEAKQLVRRVEVEGLAAVADAVCTERPDLVPSHFESDRLLIFVEFGVVVGKAGPLLVARLSVEQKDEQGRVEALIAMPVPPKDRKSFERLMGIYRKFTLAQKEIAGRYPILILGGAILRRGQYEDLTLKRIIHRELQKNAAIPSANILIMLDQQPKGVADVLQESRLFQNWKNEFGIGCWKDVKKFPILLNRWRSLVSRFKRKQHLPPTTRLARNHSSGALPSYLPRTASSPRRAPEARIKLWAR